MAERAWAKFKNKRFSRVLEPSAGDGALIRGYEHWDREYHYRPPVDAIEIDLTKHEALRKMGVSVVGIDFLEFQSAPIYTHIVQPAVPVRRAACAEGLGHFVGR